MFKNSQVTLRIVDPHTGEVDKVSFNGKLYVNFSDTWIYLSWEDGCSETFKAANIQQVSVEPIDE